MTVKLNAMAFNHAKKLTEEDRIVLDDRDEWSEHRPSAADENAYLEVSAEVRARQQKYTDIGNAAAHLHGMPDGRRAGDR
ncbi:MAG: hypothetical protein JF597_31105 [Streptomyces sp.]|uniref:hypothetical protein n=1 Tax=Streptomyces sp. TaxID=1931 RepID=UPI0025E6B3E2|nr:hypothetical protein [Streptomyces sp.]MBW8797874.1 hypothetical protein [Streptomyces sp.]